MHGLLKLREIKYTHVFICRKQKEVLLGGREMKWFKWKINATSLKKIVWNEPLVTEIDEK